MHLPCTSHVPGFGVPLGCLWVALPRLRLTHSASCILPSPVRPASLFPEAAVDSRDNPADSTTEVTMQATYYLLPFRCGEASTRRGAVCDSNLRQQFLGGGGHAVGRMRGDDNFAQHGLGGRG